MDIVKINLTSPIYGAKELNIKSIKEVGNELLIKLSGGECYDISEGMTLSFDRYVYRDYGDNFTLSQSVKVISEDENHIIHTTIPETPTFVIGKTMWQYDESIDDYAYKAVRCESGETDCYYVIGCDENHNLFAQDLALGVGQSITVRDSFGNVLKEFKELGIPSEVSYTMMTSGDCLEFIGEDATCNKDYKFVSNYVYTFLPYFFSLNMIAIKDMTPTDAFIIENAGYSFQPKFNPFYYYTINEKNERVCHFWGDEWWEKYQKIDKKTPSATYINCGETRSVLVKNDAYWKTSVGLVSEEDYGTLGSEDTFGASFIENIEDSLVPKVLDYEKYKYSPTYVKDGEKLIATSITLDFHFRERVKNDGNNTELTANNYYADGWYIDKNNEAQKFWNGYPATSFDVATMNNFINTKGKASDLLGYLNFTDNDVFYQKKKVSKTFVRLAFYTSKDPLTQKLLYYSTVFLDGSGLYGKYVNQVLNIESILSKNPNYGRTGVVFWEDNSSSSRVDSEIVITNEYDRTRSSEGFNLYLFADDAYAGNEVRTIYMKVEFNHAGNGKTIPMILWPKDSFNLPKKLTMDNFIDSLYIPVEIQYYNGKYIYSLPTADNSEDGNIRLVLFEPKLENDKYGDD